MPPGAFRFLNGCQEICYAQRRLQVACLPAGIVESGASPQVLVTHGVCIDVRRPAIHEVEQRLRSPDVFIFSSRLIKIGQECNQKTGQPVVLTWIAALKRAVVLRAELWSSLGHQPATRVIEWIEAVFQIWLNSNKVEKVIA